MAYRRQFQASNREMYRLENYKGKNSMSRSQWRRHQRMKKAEKESKVKEVGESSSSKIPLQGAKSTKPPVGRKLFSLENEMIEEKAQSSPLKEEYMITNDFDS